VSSKPSIIVHGGAWDVPGAVAEQCRKGVKRAVDRGWAVLARGGTAISACVEAILELEDEPVFDAGIGSHLNRDGRAQLDAVLMDGSSLKAGAVACVERVRNPIQLARLVLETSEHMMLCGYGAERFGEENGLALCDPAVFRIESELKLWTGRSGAMAPSFGTVGAVAVDANGNLASGTSTGGTIFKYPGRVGDSPIVGSGCYADNEGAAVSSTGHGESIMKIVMAKMINDLVAAGRSPQEAVELAVATVGRRTTGRAGAIVVDRFGRIGAAFSTKNLVRAYRTASDASPAVIV
jgi:L-asparaginase / beta-aspartyl-peptidase